MKKTQHQTLTDCFDRLGVIHTEHIFPVGDESVLSIISISDGANDIDFYFEDGEFDRIELPVER